MIKRIISSILAFCLILGGSVLILTSCSTTKDDGTLYYQLSDDKTYYSVYGLKDESASAIVIPAEFDGLPVKVIDNDAFAECENIKSITISEGITRIGSNAFLNCTNLEKISMPDSITSIYMIPFEEWYKFYGNMSVHDDAVYWGNDNNPYSLLMLASSTTKSIHENTKGIYHGAFKNSTTISITIPDSVTWIGDEAFYNDTLKRVNIGNGIIAIGNRAFKTDSVKYESYNKGKYLGNGMNPYLVLIGLQTKDIESFTIHKDTKIIHSAALSIEKLTSVTLSDSVVDIGDYAFYGSNINDIKLGSSVKRIGMEAFSCCANLSSITIPAAIEEIGQEAFDECPNLTELTYTGTKKEWKAIIKPSIWAPATKHVTNKYKVHCTDGDTK